MSTIDLQTETATLDELVDAAFGSHDDPMTLLEARAGELLAAHGPIVWECDARTFVFSFVSQNAEAVLGYPRARWTEEPTFWADVVLHVEDRDGAVSYCVAETGQCRDHTFDYRARHRDGHVVRLRDYVRVVTAAPGQPSRLRGVMIVLPEE